MKISVDTNILIGILQGSAEGNADQLELHARQVAGDELLICGVVSVELAAHPGMTRAHINALIQSTGLRLDLTMPAAAWEAATDANHAFQQRRRTSGSSMSRRVPADFLIGAHALHRADALLTRNPGDFADFPGLALLVPRP